MQTAVIEYARNVCELEKANSSTEFDPVTPFPVIDFLPEQRLRYKGASMRLGSYPCILQTGPGV